MKYKYLIIKYKNKIGITTLFVGIIVGVILGRIISDSFDAKYAENPYFLPDFVTKIIGIFGWIIWFIPPVIIYWIVFGHIVSIEKKTLNNLEVGYKNFINSLEKVPVEIIFKKFKNYNISFVLFHDKFKVEIGNYKDTYFVSAFWFNKETNKLIRSRKIDFNNEPTISDVIKNGPYFGLKFSGIDLTKK